MPAFFEAASQDRTISAKLTAFGSTRRAGIRPEEDANLVALVRSHAPVVAVFGKAWDLQVKVALRVSNEENLEMVKDTVSFLKSNGKEVVFDAEHFFDGYKSDRDYALTVLKAAAEAGADWLVLCDTNGGTIWWRM